MVVLPKHAQLPEIPGDGNLYFESMLYIFGIIVMFLQYINLYKTVWWLPHSHSNYALNFYLIDPNLVSFLAIIMCRRVVACFLQETFVVKNKGILYWISMFLKCVIVLCILALFLYTGYQVVTKYSPLYCLFLTYSFGWDNKPRLRVLQTVHVKDPRQLEIEKEQANAAVLAKCPSLHPAWRYLSSLAHMVQKKGPNRDPFIFHSCTLTPDIVRDEVEAMKQDFNSRMKQVLFNSTLTAFYMSFVPLCFAQNTLYYDTWWVGQHVSLTWLSSFLMLICHFLSPRYLDLLHKCALHLGRWQKVEGRHAHVPHNAWSELQVWPQGALVKHVRGLFKAEGINVTAEPGNSSHGRFYFLFSKPLRVLHWLLIMTFMLVIYQFFRLLQCTEWSHIMSLALILFCNYYTLFKLMRDWIIMGKSYKEEDNMNSSS
ncbi:hypothetical protein LOTGIDRAFT_117951 [Lottia gigantea]|uniref:Transmembrane protein 39A n=1 Tax=Lottia gigantea TaxID=225164 RepID=V3ZTN2_LOTGI|nr:hypothetical protein LOTGIDRAFT_117951 [Lottia gigantea]ESO94823.1 hypothetical protein LOTGIDRAFT_117951 [Lottia gigantea]